ncbi:MAG: helix-turn-helix transcriptional regulator, partial [Pirellulaceae bacterium]|nr:helix-turn-helix transcriptional regulator [Pirellulaceae bacterium]
ILIRRFVEILLVEAIRLGTRTSGESSENPMGCLLHPDLGPALNLIHRQPEKSWTVAELAEHVTMSRSAFAAAFTEALGRPPVEYLRQRRMVLAGRLLRNHSLGLKEVAMRVGYDSVSAFNSAFRQCWGIAPGRFRAEGANDRLTPRASAARGSKAPPDR